MFHVPGFIDGAYNLAFDSEKNTSTWSKFKGCAELTDFREILPKYSRDKDKRGLSGNVDTIAHPVSYYPECQALVIAYGRSSFTRV